MMHYVRLSGVNDKGIADPLDYRTEDPYQKSKALMSAVGDSYEPKIEHQAEVIPLESRRHPRLMK